MELPWGLRAWFALDAVIDVVIGMGMLLIPEVLLSYAGWTTVDPVTPRLLGAALMAMGIQSWRARGAGSGECRAILGFKVVWSIGAVLGLGIATALGAPSLTFLLLSICLAFCGVWSHHAIRFRQLAAAAIATDLDEEDASDDAPSGLPPVET